MASALCFAQLAEAQASQATPPAGATPNNAAPDKAAPAAPPAAPTTAPPKSAAQPPKTVKREPTPDKAPKSAAPKGPLPPPEISAEAKAGLSADAAQDASSAQGEGDGSTCFPKCRSGYLCHESQCISSCNPACPEGYQCSPRRQCIPLGAPPFASRRGPAGSQPPRYYPWPPVPTSDMNEPPPDAWEPTFPDDYDYGHPEFIGTVGLQLGLGGVGSVHTAGDGRNERIGSNYALDAGGGVEAAFEFRFHHHFGLAPGLRMFQVRSEEATESSTTLDLLVVPTFHLPLGQVELMLPVPLGLSFGSAPDDVLGGDGAGITIGFTPGLIAWISEQVGVYTQFGFIWHIRGYEANGLDYVYRFRRPVLTVGLAFAD